ncbi:hypothetical protein CH352_11830 [Leptospira hartskeerlii]|uniref:DUF2971 domain-containing protein n=1 Tax=Leptospira hartskeerlii TaxID=2023177 RepID=A0A2M9X862_9LEPT|nr:DUF2971 domain-containing protein [Leptospira hartskeerlii]PJZ23887.1 hypothetical protein CH357_18840 [Leptospira hartskeerlii]PJZ33018.1 hypothetical protein CH352_11830 [Leptospira hartskeerlii]
MYVYKYRGINANTNKILTNKVLWFSQAKDFNDPFDCRIISIYSGSQEEWISLLVKYGVNRNEAISLAKKLENRNLTDEDLKTELLHYHAGLTEDINRIFCLSKRPDSILMWSHYSQDHKGLCFAFNVELVSNSKGIKVLPNQLNLPDNLKFLNEFVPFFDVIYQEDMPPTHNGLKSSGEAIIPFIKTKYKDWEYEEEVRLHLISNWLPGNALNYEDSSFAGVIFGMKMDAKEERKIYELIKNNFSTKKWFKKCYPHPTKYEVVINDIPDIDEYLKQKGV